MQPRLDDIATIVRTAHQRAFNKDCGYTAAVSTAHQLLNGVCYKFVVDWLQHVEVTDDIAWLKKHLEVT